MMKRNIYKMILLVAVLAPLASCHTHKKQTKQPEQKVLRPVPRNKNF